MAPHIEVLKHLILYWDIAAALAERQRQSCAAGGATSLAVRCLAAHVYATERVQKLQTLLQDELSTDGVPNESEA